jgi:hypothetical protein
MVDQTATSGSVGAGQQEPEDGNSDFYVAKFIIEQLQAQIEIAMPVEVVAVHPGTGSPPSPATVDVRILVSQLDGAGNAVPAGIVYGVPCHRLQGGPWALILDPAANEFGYIIAASRDISSVVKNPGVQAPGSWRKYSYSDGVYFGGILNGVPAATFWFKTDGTFVLTDKYGNVLESTPSGLNFSVGGIPILSLTSSLANFAVGVKAPDFITSTLASYAGHTHPVPDAPGESGPPTTGT